MNVTSNDEVKCAIGLAGLKHVDDPEIGLNVVDLGLIYELDFNEETKQVTCTMTLTTEFCPMGESIVDNCKDSLQASFPEYSIDVNLIFDPPWSFEKISEEGRAFLGR
ncbi:MAG: metal-sulfur cluster assembly factor [Bacteroidia bacterium]|nr:metal-sulfur cluster assembly factor [Bacteroidia bacterium]